MIKKIVKTIIICLMITVFCIGSFSAHPGRNSSLLDKYREQLGGSGTQKYMQLEVWDSAMQFGDYEGFADDIRSGAIWEEVVEILMNEGYYTEYYQEFKEAGWVSSDYTLPSSVAKNTLSSSSTQVVAPSPVTTTKCDEKTIWAKSAVNVRENGSTSYKKVASLQKDEQVTVTGIDSTGWYEIRKADGTVGHVSDKYLTEVDPSVSAASEETVTPSESPKKQSEIISIDGRTVVWYNAETEREEEVTFNEETPLEDIEEYANTYLINGGGLVEEVTPEPTVEPEETPVVTTTPEATPSPVETATLEPTDELEQQEDSLIVRITNSPVFIFGCIIVGLGAVITGIVMIVKNKRK